MKRLTYALLIAALSTTMIWQVASAQTSREIRDRDRWGRYGSLDGVQGVSSDEEVRKTIRWAAERWNVSYTTALAIAQRESGLNPRATNPSSGACGIYQAYPASSFHDRVTKFNREVPNANAGPSCYNGRSNIIVHVRIMSRTLSPWGG